MSFLLRAVTFGDTICCRRTKVNRKLSCHPQPADDSVLCLESRRVMSGSAQFLCRAAGVARSLSSSAWAPQLSSRPSRSHARRLAQSSEVCPAKLRPYVRPSVRDDRQASSRLPVALRPLFKLGERQQLACFVDDCPVTPVISWTPLDDRPLNARVRTRDNLSLLTFEPVDMEHEGPLLCKVTCGEQHKQAKTHIRLYAFPSDPEIRGHDPVRAGEESTLTCQLRDLYPAESLTLDWLRGGQVVRSVPGEAGATSVQSAYTFTPQRAESGENLTCRATLDLHDLPPPERTRQTVTRLHVTFAPVVTVLSDPGTVSSGSVLILSCSASGNPAPVLMWTFRPEDGGPLEVKGHSETLVLAAQAGEFRCEARNHEGKDSKAVRVRINASPSNTSMLVSPGRELMEGQRVTFTCRSHGAPPPVLVLSREGEELWRSDSTPWLTFSLSVRPDDAGQYRCDASNPLGTQRVTQNVTVAAPPRNTTVVVTPSAAVSAGQNVTVSCRSAGFPPPDVVLERAADGTQRRSADGVFRLLNVTVRDSGLYRVNASNPLGHQVRVFRLSVTEPGARTLPALAAILVPVAAALVLDHLRRSKKKGSYRLTSSTPAPEQHPFSG
ncbi:vascular cell adhesion protein 1b isoform X3 [Syngnathus scovelli]|uniref:vascular cell adhesion protein 1b isoform X3 n=1 Tax=Syngnathus scovelli TaxID=161590 RepID=UPI00210FDB5E|nr:vascular cell adhesion protein 1b isoform X3 [Syngnathus scovelli]